MRASLTADAPRADISHDVVQTARTPRTQWRWLLLVAGWLTLLGGGLYVRFDHGSSPGAVGVTPALFPQASRVPRSSAGSTLLMFVHPECPCTRASLRELRTLLAHTHVDVQPVLVVAPLLDANTRWEETPAAKLALEIRGLRIYQDGDEAEAARFGAQTSSHVVLYDRQGLLQFAGGITASRGHEGDNMGLQLLRARLTKSNAETARHAVFGCPLSSAALEAPRTP